MCIKILKLFQKLLIKILTIFKFLKTYILYLYKMVYICTKQFENFLKILNVISY